ncbi:DUF507 family protein [bacterium]|nr:DUF507 family protein [bacterium]
MRLKPFQIQMVSQKILQTLKTRQLVILKKSEPEVLKKMEEIFTADLKIEDALNIEAEKLLEAYTAKMGDKIDRQKMFQMIKKQLIKDRGLVI